jgi:hypothetical protein
MSNAQLKGCCEERKEVGAFCRFFLAVKENIPLQGKIRLQNCR